VISIEHFLLAEIARLFNCLALNVYLPEITVFNMFCSTRPPAALSPLANPASCNT
jgi:hypothetical protein